MLYNNDDGLLPEYFEREINQIEKRIAFIACLEMQMELNSCKLPTTIDTLFTTHVISLKYTI
jgi:hypothetical protein